MLINVQGALFSYIVNLELLYTSKWGSICIGVIEVGV